MTITDPRVQDSVGTALRLVRENWRGVATTAGIGALAATAVQIIGGLAPQLPFLTIAVVMLLNAMVYAVFVGLALRGGAVRFRGAEGLRLFGAMAVVAFFLCIVGFVLAIVGGTILVAGPYAAYARDIASASGDQAAVNRLLVQIWIRDPWPMLVLCGVFLAVWFYLTTRLYLAAPATVDRGRILTFETWGWTKNVGLKIAGARAVLIGPAFVLTFALIYLIARAAGIDLFNMEGAQPNAGAAFVYVISTAFISYCVGDALSAGLSTALYRDLGGQNTQLPPR